MKTENNKLNFMIAASTVVSKAKSSYYQNWDLDQSRLTVTVAR